MTNSATTDPFTDKTLPRRRARCALCPSPADFRVQVQIQQLNSDSRPKPPNRARARPVRAVPARVPLRYVPHERGVPAWRAGGAVG